MSTSVVAVIVLTVLVTSPLYAGKRATVCRDENGSPYLTDVSCPTDTEKVGTAYLPNAQGYSRQWSQGDGAMLQNHEQRIQKNLAARAASVQQQQQQQPTMTYEEARKRAVGDAGYQKYGQLTKSQKERVHEEMSKYNHLPPKPLEPAQATAETQRQLLVNGVPATAVGGGNYIDNATGHFLQGAAGGVIDTTTQQFLPTH